MLGLNFYHVVAQALEAGKLFHIDLNDQKPGRFDQDLRFGSESIKPLFFLVKLLEESGYDGPRHFDAHAYRTEDADGVWDFARGCMRTYLILKAEGAAVRRASRDSGALAEIRGRTRRCPPYSRAACRAAEGAHVRSRRRWPRGRSPTSGWISSSWICCSACADGREGRASIPRTRLEHAEPHRGRHRGGRRRPGERRPSRRR